MNNFDDAVTNINQAISILETHYPKYKMRDIVTYKAWRLNCEGRKQFINNNFADAKSTFTNALQMMISSRGENHPNTKTTQKWLDESIEAMKL